MRPLTVMRHRAACMVPSLAFYFFPIYLMAQSASSSSAHTSGPWNVYRGPKGEYLVQSGNGQFLASMATGFAPLDAENANLIATAPDLLHLAKVFRMTCEDRLSLLKEDEKYWRPDDEWQDMIGHYTSLLKDCKRVIGRAEGGA